MQRTSEVRIQRQVQDKVGRKIEQFHEITDGFHGSDGVLATTDVTMTADECVLVEAERLNGEDEQHVLNDDGDEHYAGGATDAVPAAAAASDAGVQHWVLLLSQVNDQKECAKRQSQCGYDDGNYEVRDVVFSLPVPVVGSGLVTLLVVLRLVIITHG